MCARTKASAMRVPVSVIASRVTAQVTGREAQATSESAATSTHSMQAQCSRCVYGRLISESVLQAAADGCGAVGRTDLIKLPLQLSEP